MDMRCHGCGVLIVTLTFDSSPIKREGYMVGVVLFTRVTLPPCGLRIKSAMTVCAAGRPFHRHTRLHENTY